MSTGTVIDGAREIGRQIETAHLAIKHGSSGTTTGSETPIVLGAGEGRGTGEVRPAGSESSIPCRAQALRRERGLLGLDKWLLLSGSALKFWYANRVVANTRRSIRMAAKGYVGRAAVPPA